MANFAQASLLFCLFVCRQCPVSLLPNTAKDALFIISQYRHGSVEKSKATRRCWILLNRFELKRPDCVRISSAASGVGTARI